MSKSERSLAHRLQLIGLISLAICFFGYYIIFSKNFDHYDSVMREKTIGEIEKAVGTELVNILRNIQNEAYLIGQYPIVAAAVGSGDSATIVDVLEGYGLNLNFSFIEVLNVKGKYIAGLPNGNSIAPESFYQQLLIRRFGAEEKSTYLLPTEKQVYLVAMTPIGNPPDASGWLVVGKAIDSAVLGEFCRGPRVQVSFYSLDRKRLATTLDQGSEKNLEELKAADQAIASSAMSGLEVSLPTSRIRFLSFNDPDGRTVGQLAVHISLEDYLKQRSQNERTFLIYSLIFIGVLVPVLVVSTGAALRPFVGMFARLRKVVSRNTLQMAESGRNRWSLGEGVTKKCAVLFIDIRDFTLYCSGIPSSRALTELSAYQTLMLAIIHKHGGDVEKFMGDGILVVFDSEKNRSYAAACLETVNEILSVMRSQEWTALFNKKLNLALACSMGEATFGLIGDADRQEMTIIGVPVNSASKLEVHAKFLNVTNLMRIEDFELAVEQGLKIDSQRVRKFKDQVRGFGTADVDLVTISNWT